MVGAAVFEEERCWSEGVWSPMTKLGWRAFQQEAGERTDRAGETQSWGTGKLSKLGLGWAGSGLATEKCGSHWRVQRRGGLSPKG